MSCLGVHCALTEMEVAHIRSLNDEQDRLEHLQEVIEDHYLIHLIGKRTRRSIERAPGSTPSGYADVADGWFP